MTEHKTIPAAADILNRAKAAVASKYIDPATCETIILELLALIEEEAATMKPGELYWSLVDLVWGAISIYDGEETFLKQYNTAPLTSRTLFAAHWCRSEVRNGGLHQFFGNSTGVLAPEAVLAFQSIGMPKTAAVVSEAMSWFGPSYPRDREVRNEQLGGWDTFKNLNDQFFQLAENENGGFILAADAYAKRSGLET